jgi:hypothetical protein
MRLIEAMEIPPLVRGRSVLILLIFPLIFSITSCRFLKNGEDSGT